jgi:hypothetical protein
MHNFCSGLLLSVRSFQVGEERACAARSGHIKENWGKKNLLCVLVRWRNQNSAKGERKIDARAK